MSSAIMGVGATHRLSAVRRGSAGQIVMGWLVTVPACFALERLVRTLIARVGG
jgi:PiT family inorganic phosphate transporter